LLVITFFEQGDFLILRNRVLYDGSWCIYDLYLFFVLAYELLFWGGDGGGGGEIFKKKKKKKKKK